MYLAIALSAIAVAVALITRKNVMSTVERLEQLVTKLNETITTEAAQQQAAIANLRSEIENGADAASLGRIADELEASIARVAAIVPDSTDATTDTPADGESDSGTSAEAEQ